MTFDYTVYEDRLLNAHIMKHLISDAGRKLARYLIKYLYDYAVQITHVVSMHSTYVEGVGGVIDVCGRCVVDGELPATFIAQFVFEVGHADESGSRLDSVEILDTIC